MLRCSWALSVVTFVVLLAACGSPPDAPDGATQQDAGEADASRADASAGCSSGCDDGVYCNGEERCDPARGCVAGTPPCSTGQTCSESEQRCIADPCAPPMDDADGDGQRSIACGGTDCDDTNADRFAGNTEVCDAADLDEDCDPTTFGNRDVDSDHAIDAQCCNVASDGTRTCGNDCDDTRSNVSPALLEACDGLDNDCNRAVDDGVLLTFYRDADGDARGVDTDTVQACAAPPGYAGAGGDCDDANPGRNPSAPEACDGIDNDCDDVIDESVISTLYRDADGDGFGTPTETRAGCMTVDGWVTLSTDCDDTNAGRNPGATEVCDGIDNDCDGATDELVRNVYYRDADGDMFGVASMTVEACSAPAGYAARPGDCDDTNASRHPSATEVCDGVDNNCDLVVDEGVRITYYRDSDGDGVGTARMTTLACSLPTGYAASPGDCDDTTDRRRPGLAEVCDGIDNNCDFIVDEGVRNVYYADADGDGYGVAAPTTLACSLPAGYSTRSDDCDDTRINVNPGAPEICDGRDNNCNGSSDEGVLLTFYRDVDGDGYGLASMTTTGCTAPGGYAAMSGDCRDDIATVHPGATELCDGYDTDCIGGLSYPGEDNDGDGHGDAAACAGAPAADDCDDTRADTYAGAPELCDRRDNDCSSGGGVLTSEDADNDGFAPAGAACSGGPLPKSDCDDARPSVVPGFDECTSTTARRVCPASGGTWSNVTCTGGAPLCDYRNGDCVASGAACGDAYVSPGEECDDANAVDLDACDNACRTVPGATRPITPYSGTASRSRRPTFRVSAATTAATYEVAVSTARSFATTAMTFTLTSTSGTPPSDLPTGRLWWRVRAVSASGAIGPWSNPFRLRVGRARGDLTGDGVADWGFGDPTYRTVWSAPSYGRAYVVPGGTGTRILLPSPSALYFGNQVTVADVNCDNIDDLIVSSQTTSYVYLGGAGGTSFDTTSDLTISASGVSGVGDVNGDGCEDVVGFAAGIATLFYGGSPFDATADATLPGTYGGAVGRPGDVDGDGLDDVLVCASGGTLYRASALATPITLPGISGGCAVADLDRDGYGDIVGAGAGQVRMWRGSATPDSTSDWSVGGLIGDSFYSASTGDPTGDGYLDVLFSSNYTTAYRVSGGAGDPTLGTIGSYDNVAAIDDLTGDGRDDLLATDSTYDGVEWTARVQLFRTSDNAVVDVFVGARGPLFP